VSHEADDALAGAIASAFFGGWSAAPVVHVPSPAVLGDISGAYTWAAEDLALQRYLISAETTVRDVTPEVRSIEPRTCSELLDGRAPLADRLVLVRVRPRGQEWLPSRPVRDGRTRLCIAPLDLHGSGAWWWFSDIEAGVYLGGDWPGEIDKALEFVAGEPQAGLGPVRLPTGRMVDLYSEDLAAVIREERARVRCDNTLAVWKRDGLAGLLRLLGTTVYFGNLSRIDRIAKPHPQVDWAIGPGGRRLTIKTRHPEVPGPYFDMAMAGLVTAHVRREMACTVAHLRERDGSWLHAATDSILVAATHGREPQFVPCPGGAQRDGRTRGFLAVPLEDVRAVFAESKAPWKEEAGFDRPMTGYVSGTYRFALVDPAGGASIATEAALGGVYSDPTGTNERTPDGHFAWAVAGHLAVARAGIAWDGKGPVPDLELPCWADEMVTRPGTASSWEQVRRLERAYPGRRIRPFTPYLQAVVDRRWSKDVVPVTLDVDLPPGEQNWHDQRTSGPLVLTTTAVPAPGMTRVITHRELLEAWRLPQDPTTTSVARLDHVLDPGLRRPVPVLSREGLFQLAGKEGDNLLSLLVDPGANSGDDLNVYQRPDTWLPLFEKALAVGLKGLVAAGVPERTARRILKGGRPSPETAALVAESLGGCDVMPTARVCALPGCGHAVRSRQRFHSDRCRKAAARASDRLALNVVGAVRCARCRAVRYGDTTGPCPVCQGRGVVEVEAVACTGCGTELVGDIQSGCPVCGLRRSA
jgi:hypothetical protein